jgi:tripartite-type tricarboxylate transporter receptor subunit TctC
MHRRIAAAFALALAAAAPLAALAQGAYPTRAVTIIVPYPPSGSNDVFARAVAKKFSESMGQPFVVENKPGASGMIGAQMVSTAKPDGYTIMLLSSSFTTGAAVAQNLPFDPVKGFAPIGMVAKGPMILTVANDKPVKSLVELVAFAKANPGKLNYASSGNGSTNQFAAELFKSAAKVEMTHVPYKGMGPATTDVIAGHVDVLFASGPSILPHVKTGKVRAIAVTSEKASPIAPDLPTVASVAPGYRFELWWGMLAPPATPPEILAKLNAELNKALASAEMKDLFAKEGAEGAPMSVAEFGKTVESEIAGWRRVAQQAKIKVE